MNLGLRMAAFAVLLSLASTLPAAAQMRSVAEVRAALPALKPGQFLWYEAPQLVKASVEGGDSIAIVVSLAAQQAYVFRGGRMIAVSTVSTGSSGHATPSGEFTILQKKEFHRSNLYSNAPMPHMQRLTWTGIALHAGHLPGYPASHGCIRLPKAFARQLYDLTDLGGTVSVVEDVYGDPSLYAPIQQRFVPAPQIAAETHGLGGALAVPERPAPTLAVETRNLGGGAYDVVTMRGDPPLLEPASWPGKARRGSR